MKIIEQRYEILDLPFKGIQLLEVVGRTCYQSKDQITNDSAEKFVNMLVDKQHHAMIEFGDIIVKFVTNRGVTHELVRHRMCSFAQESTRYVKYSGDMVFIRPVWMDNTEVNSDAVMLWESHMLDSETRYRMLLENGWKAQQAREILPNSLKTEIVVKANIREWRHIFSLRCAKASHPQIVALMTPLRDELKTLLPVVFDGV